jgi:hypothetical protein
MGRREKQSHSVIRFIYKPLLLFAVFIAALWYFSGHYLTIKSFTNVTDETTMAEASLPALSLVTEGREVNRLCGYTSNLDWELNRETITPLSTAASFVVKVAENKLVARKLKYELFDVSTGSLLETNTVNSLNESIYPGYKSMEVTLKTDLARGVEYSVKFTLITSDSRRIYYYTRIKVYDKGYIAEKIDYAVWFRDSLISKTNQAQIEKNLEPKSNSNRTDLAHVDIDCTWNMASWGNAYPKIVSELPPTITDFYEEYASIVLNYVAEVKTDSGTEYLRVRETIRLLYTTIRTYLYTYDRVTETIYDVANTYLYSSDLKLGITNDTEMQILTTPSYKYTAFVHNGELYCYDGTSNKMTTVFSFAGEDITDPDVAKLDHDVKILNLDANGNIDFVVCGYMSRGEYEGRVGIVFYTFDREHSRLTELAYIPVNTTYQLLKDEFDKLVYKSSYNIIYLAMYDTVYSYNITTRKLSVLANNVPEGHFAYLAAAKKILWQNNANDAKSDKLTLMNLESGEKLEWEANPGEVIRLLGEVDGNAIIGYARIDDIVRNSDGSQVVPMYRVEITDWERKVLKTYSQPDIFVTDVKFGDSVIILERVKKSGSGLAYEAVAADGIANRNTAVTLAVSLVNRTSNLLKKEYYIAFPSNITMKEIPKKQGVTITVQKTDTSMKINAGTDVQAFYRTYSFGRVVTRTSVVADAIALADSNEGLGAVIDGNGRIVWERGVKATRSAVTGLILPKTPAQNQLQTCLKILFRYLDYDVDTSEIDFSKTNVADSIKSYVKVSGLELKGITLDQMLYFVYRKKPVIAVINNERSVLVTGYDYFNIEYFDPQLARTVKITKEAAEQLFGINGNTFYCYVK